MSYAHSAHNQPTVIDAQNILNGPSYMFVCVCVVCIYIYNEIHAVEVYVVMRVSMCSVQVLFLPFSIVAHRDMHSPYIGMILSYTYLCVRLSTIKRGKMCFFRSLSISLTVSYIVVRCMNVDDAAYHPLSHYIYIHTHVYECVCILHWKSMPANELRMFTRPGRISFVYPAHSNSLLWTFDSCAEDFYARAHRQRIKTQYALTIVHVFALFHV